MPTDNRSILYLSPSRNLLLPTDSDSQSLPELVTINNDYCQIDAQTLKRKLIHRAGFFLYKRGSLRSTRQVRWRLLHGFHCFYSSITNAWLSSNTIVLQSIIKLGRTRTYLIRTMKSRSMTYGRRRIDRQRLLRLSSRLYSFNQHSRTLLLTLFNHPIITMANIAFWMQKNKRFDLPVVTFSHHVSASSFSFAFSCSIYLQHANTNVSLITKSPSLSPIVVIILQSSFLCSNAGLRTNKYS